MLDVLGLGSAYVDYFVEVEESYLPTLGITRGHDSYFNDEKLVEAILSSQKVLAKSPGGSTPNTLAVLGWLGARVEYAGIIGEDADGEFWSKKIRKWIEKSYSIKCGKMSKSIALLTHDRQTRNFTWFTNFHDSDIVCTLKKEAIESAQYIHVTQYYHEPQQTFDQLLQLLTNTTTPISFSPGFLYAEFGLPRLSPFLKKTTVLFLNKIDLEILTGQKEKLGSRQLIDYGPQIVVCTLGARGALITTPHEQFLSPGVAVEKIVDTTGAGDAFAGAFLHGLLQKKPLREVAELANKIAAKSVTDYGLNWLNNLS